MSMVIGTYIDNELKGLVFDWYKYYTGKSSEIRLDVHDNTWQIIVKGLKVFLSI